MSFATSNNRPYITTNNLQSTVYSPKAKPLPTPPSRGSKNISSVNVDISRTAHEQITLPVSQVSSPLKGKVMKQSPQSIPSQSKENVLSHRQEGNVSKKNGSTPLLSTVQESLQILLNCKTGLTLSSQEQETIFETTILHGLSRELEDLLKNFPNAKQFIHVKDQNGKSSLHKAVCGASKPEIINLLIKYGADVHAQDNSGYTPLDWATTNQHSASAAILIQHGSKINLVNNTKILPPHSDSIPPSKALELRRKAATSKPNDELTLTLLIIEETSEGNYERALQISLNMLATTKKAYGEHSKEVASLYNRIANSCSKLMLTLDEIEYRKKILEIRLQFLEENPLEVANSYNSLGLTHEKLGNDKQAQECFQMALKTQLEVLQKNPNTPNPNLPWTYRYLKEYDKALDCLQKNLTAELHGDANSYYIDFLNNNIGEVYFTLKNYQKALEFHQKALKNRSLSVEKKDHNAELLFKIYNNIGEDFKSLGDFDNALKHFKIAVEFLFGLHKQSHPDLLVALRSLILFGEKLSTQQLKNLKSTHQLCVKTLGAKHELTFALSQLIK